MKKHKEKIIAVVVFILANIICPILVSKVENIDFINAFITMWKAIYIKYINFFYTNMGNNYHNNYYIYIY